MYPITIISAIVSLKKKKLELCWKPLQQRRKWLRLTFFDNLYYGSTGLDVSKYTMAPSYVSRKINTKINAREVFAKTDVLKIVYPKQIMIATRDPNQL